jgi:hypothetical protein
LTLVGLGKGMWLPKRHHLSMALVAFFLHAKHG